MALPGLLGERRPTKARVRLTMPMNVAPYPNAPANAAHNEPDTAGNTTDSVCKPKAKSSACLSPHRRATRSQIKTAGMAAKPTIAQAKAPCPANAGSRSTMATVKVALMTKPQPAAK